MTDPAVTDGVICAVPAEALEPLGARRLALLVSVLAEMDERIAPRDPQLGLAMLRRLMALAGPIHERAQYHGEIGAVFDKAGHDIARAAAAA